MKEVIRKIRFSSEGVILNSPADLLKEFTALGYNTSFEGHSKCRNTLVFINNHQEFSDFLDNHLQSVEFDSNLWFAYPKGSSKIKCDINRDILREAGTIYGIATVAAISVNDTWSALRFRPAEKVGK